MVYKSKYFVIIFQKNMIYSFYLQLMIIIITEMIFYTKINL